MTINKINSITISKYKYVDNGQRYGVKFEMMNPTNLTVDAESCDERGCLGNIVLWRLNMNLKELFADDTDVIIDMEVVDNNGDVIHGKYNLITEEFNEVQDETN